MEVKGGGSRGQGQVRWREQGSGLPEPSLTSRVSNSPATLSTFTISAVSIHLQCYYLSNAFLHMDSLSYLNNFIPKGNFILSPSEKAVSLVKYKDMAFQRARVAWAWKAGWEPVPCAYGGQLANFRGSEDQ